MGQIDVEYYLKPATFQPFTVLLTNGRRLEVKHPDLASLSRTAITIARPPRAEKGETEFRPLTVSLFHVIEVERVADA